MTAKASLMDWSGFLPALRESLRNADAPLTAKELRSKLTSKVKPSARDVQTLLDENVSHGEFYRWEPSKGKTPRYWHRSPESQARQPLIDGLGTVDEPVTAEQIRKHAKLDVPLALVQKLLEALVVQGTCRRYEPLKGKSFRYWAGDPSAYARRVMLGTLEKGKGKSRAPMRWADLAKAVKTPLKGISEDCLSQTLQDLLDDGEAFKTLKFSPAKPDLYSTKPPDLVAAVRESFGELYKKFAVAGVSEDKVNQAARTVLGVPTRAAPSDLAGAVKTTFAALKREKYGHTGLVPIPELRHVIAANLGAQAASHEVLDPVIKHLVKEGALTIIPLNDASGTSIEDRNDGIPGSQETWFYLESR